MERKARKWGWKSSWFNYMDTHHENGLRYEGVCQADKDDAISAIIAAYKQMYGWDGDSVDEWFEGPTEAEIRDKYNFDPLDYLDVQFMGGSSGMNEYNISVWPVDDDTEVTFREK